MKVWHFGFGLALVCLLAWACWPMHAQAIESSVGQMPLPMVATELGDGAPEPSDLSFITGVLSATELEASEGYFVVGEAFSIVTKPGTSTHDWATKHRDERVRVTLEPLR